MDIFVFEWLKTLQILTSVALSESLTSRNLYNVALNKATAQSTTFSKNGYEGSSSHAVDGVLDPAWGHRSCASTNWLPDEGWWQVDLGRGYNVSNVTIQNRLEHPEYLFNFKIEVAEDFLQATTEIIGTQRCNTHPLGGIGAGELKTFQCPDNTLGRYVRITRNAQQQNRPLTLCEVIVEVRADQCTKLDLAVNKTATQSSTHITDTTTYGHAWRSVDGNLAPNMYEHNSCSHVNDTGYQWWQVDLGRLYHIKQVSTQSRELTGSRMNNFTVEVSNTYQTDMYNPDLRLCYNYTGPPIQGSTLKSLTCPNNLIGRYVRVSKIVHAISEDPLHFCEVIVEGGDPSCIGFTTTEAESATIQVKITTQSEVQSTEVKSTTTEAESTTTEVEPTTTELTITTQYETQTSGVQHVTTDLQTLETTAHVLEASSQVSTLPTERCPCRCKNSLALQKYYNQTVEVLVEKLKEKLMVDKKQTSSYTRKLVSVDDGKTSSRSIGYVAAILLVSMGLTIVVPDVITLVIYLKNK